MGLRSSSRLGDDGLVKEGVSEKDQGITEVFDELCPPPCIEAIRVRGYFGRRLPRWIMPTATMPLNSLRMLEMEDLACCTQLPNGLCHLPCLEFLEVNHAPAIKRVGPEFVQPHSHHLHPSSQAMTAFPRLQELILNRMVEWEEWEWEEEVQAMPILEELFIQRCKLMCILPGLASNARALKKLTISNVQRLQSLDNFASVVELELYNLPDLTRISNFPKLQKLKIDCCGKLESVQEMHALRRLGLQVYYSEERLLASMALGKSGAEWEKFSHIQHVEAYTKFKVEGIEKRWHLLYTSDPYSMEPDNDLKEWLESRAARRMQ